MADHDDELARLRAQMDQGKEGLKELAGSLWVFYEALVAEGFDAGVAVALTVSFLTAGIQGGGGE